MKTVEANHAMNLYEAKDSDYFSRARTEIEPFLRREQNSSTRALEVGCSQGHTLEWLKNAGYCDWVAGVEPYSELDASVKSIDRFFKIDIEKELPDITAESLDIILCLDVLEHLVNPWETVRRLDTLLKPGGTFIVSVPNVRNYHILVDLAFRGKFTYSEAGILDRTHLRFFTRETAIELVQSAGAKVSDVIGTETERWQKRLLKSLGLTDLLAKQFLLCAHKEVSPSQA